MRRRRQLRLQSYSSEEEEEGQNDASRRSINHQDDDDVSATITSVSQIPVIPPNPNSPPHSHTNINISSDDDFEDVTEHLSSPSLSPESPINVFLVNFGLRLRSEWLESCVNELDRSVEGFTNLDVPGRAKLCFGEFLYSDMNYSGGGGVLPDNISQMHLVDLAGPFVLQVDEIVNISCPLRGRYQNAAPGIKRCLKLSMTDGVQRVFGMEYRPIKDLDLAAHAGMKVSIRNVHVRRGLLMLVPEVIDVLGGLVEKLEAARGRLVNELNKPPRGKRTRSGVVLPLATRATQAAWPPTGETGVGQTRSSVLRNSNTSHPSDHGVAAPISRSASSERIFEESVIRTSNLAWPRTGDNDVGHNYGSVIQNSHASHPSDRGVTAPISRSASSERIFEESVIRTSNLAWPRTGDNEVGHNNGSVLQNSHASHPSDHGVVASISRSAPTERIMEESFTRATNLSWQPTGAAAPNSRNASSERILKEHGRPTLAASPPIGDNGVEQTNGTLLRYSNTSFPSHHGAAASISGSVSSERFLEECASAISGDNAELNHYPSAASRAEDIHMVDVVEPALSGRKSIVDDQFMDTVTPRHDVPMVSIEKHHVMLSSNSEIPFTYMARLLGKWVEMKSSMTSIQGNIKCSLTGVKDFRYKGQTRFDLWVYIDDGSLISEILIDPSAIEKEIGYSHKEVTAALSSTDQKVVSGMKEKMRKLQSFLENFEGMMLIEMNGVSPLPVALKMSQGCLASDAWLLLRRLKAPASAQARASFGVVPIDLSP